MTDLRHQAEGNVAGATWRGRLLLCLGSILVAVIGVEVALHVLDQPRFLKPHSAPIQFAFVDRPSAYGPLYLNQPGRITFRYDGNPRAYFDSNNEVHHDVNPGGFRGPAFTPKSGETLRAVFLGDSCTFGEGVRNEDTYAEVAARLLRKEAPRAEACNLGVGGYNTAQENEVLKLFGFDLDPDVVILGYTINDAEPRLFDIDLANGKPVRRQRDAFLEEAGSFSVPPSSTLYRLRLARLAWKAQQARRLSEQTIDYYTSLHAAGSPGRVESERELRDILLECKKRDIPCIVVMFPIFYRLSDDYPLAAIHQQIGDVVQQAGGRFIDLLPALTGMAARELIVHPTDQHPNEKVHAIAGRLVAEEIRRLD